MASRFPGGVRRVPRVVRFAPVVEPAVPELHARERPARLILAQLLEPLVGARAEVDGLEHARQSSPLQHGVGGTVGCEQRHVDPARRHRPFEIAQILMVGPKTAVLVLDLHGDDRPPALGALQRRQQRHQAVVISVDRVQIGRVHAADLHPRIGQQPRGKSAEIPLGADIRARTDDDEQVQARGDFDKPD